MTMRRRGFLALAGITAAGVAGCGPSGGGPLVRLASGEVGGFYHAFAGLLSAAAARSGTVRIERVTTSGSQENLTLLRQGQVDAALALSDSVGDSADRMLALGRVYENYLQLVVRSDSRIGSVADLRGARINLGADGSGAALTGERILRVAGLDPATDVAVSHRPLREAVTALAADESDALLWAGGVPTMVLQVPARMRLVDMGDLAAPMRERFGPVYDRVEIPADAYPGGSAVHTIGVANLLLVAAGLPADTAASIVELLVYRADSLVPTEAAGTQFLDGRSLISTAPIPLHPGAAAVYRKWHG